MSGFKKFLSLFGALLFVAVPVRSDSIVNDETIRILYDHYPPRYHIKDGKLTGSFYLKAERLFRRAGVQPEFRATSFNRIKRSILANEKNTCIAGYNYPDDYQESAENLGEFTERPPNRIVFLNKNRFKFFKKSGLEQIFGAHDLKGAFLNGVKYSGEIGKYLDKYRDRQLLISGEDDDTVRLLLGERVDYIFLSDGQWEYYKKSMMKDFDVSYMEVPEKGPAIWTYLICTRSTPQKIRKRLRSELRLMQLETSYTDDPANVK